MTAGLNIQHDAQQLVYYCLSMQCTSLFHTKLTITKYFNAFEKSDIPFINLGSEILIFYLHLIKKYSTKMIVEYYNLKYLIPISTRIHVKISCQCHI